MKLDPYLSPSTKPNSNFHLLKRDVYLKKKVCKSQSQCMAPRKQCLPGTTELLHIRNQRLWHDNTCTTSSQTNSSLWRRESRHDAPPPNQKTIYNRYLLVFRIQKASFPHWSDSIYIYTTPQEQLANTKGTPCFFVCYCSCYSLLYFVCLFSWVLIIVYLFGKRKKQDFEWVRR